MLKKGGKFKEMGIIALFIVLALIPACFKKQAVLQRSSATTTASHEKILPDDPEGTDNAIKSIIFTDPKHGWAVGKKGSIFYTKNGGKVWLPQKNESKKETLVRVFFTDTKHGWAVGWSTVLHTDDGGDTWIRQDNGIEKERMISSVFFSDPMHGWIVGDLGGVVYTADGGKNWFKRFIGYEYILRDLFFIGNNGWVTGERADDATASFYLQSKDAGYSWEEVRVGNSGSFNSIFFIDPLIGWTVGGYSLIRKTVDGGKSWMCLGASDFVDKGMFLNDVFFADKDNGWIVGEKGLILHTENGGDRWDYQESGVSSDLNELFFTSKEEGWCVSDGGSILHTTNRGEKWERQRIVRREE